MTGAETSNVFVGLGLMTVAYGVICWFAYKDWLLFKMVLTKGTAFEAEFNSAEKRNGADGSPEFVINYSFVPPGGFRMISVSKAVDITTFERYQNASKVSIRYLRSDPYISKIIENDITIWNFWFLGIFAFALTFFWIAALARLW